MTLYASGLKPVGYGQPTVNPKKPVGSSVQAAISRVGIEPLFQGQSEPTPRWRLKNLRNALLFVASVTGFWYGPGQVANLHQAAQQRAEHVQTVADDGNPTDRMLDTLAKVDTRTRSLPLVANIEDLYVDWILRFELLSLAFATMAGMGKKSIRPEELYAELHQRGITGKGIKVGVVDTGYLPTRTLPGHRVTFFNPENLSKPASFSDSIGHGTAVSNLIARILPDAEFVMVPYSSKKQLAQAYSAALKVISNGKRSPNSLTTLKIHQAFAPTIQNIANGVRKAVDEGAQVVNVSLRLEQVVQMALRQTLMLTAVELTSKRFFSTKAQREMRPYQETLAFFRRLQELCRLTQSEPITDELRNLYKPWVDALDYAQSKGAAVVLSAGNAGGHKNVRSNSIGNTNLLAVVKHPALIVVGSTDESGTVSAFTSEFNDIITPDLAANGSGELTTAIAGLERDTVMKILSPLANVSARLKYANPPGTSFAAPDITALYGMMKAVNPGLTTGEIRRLMLQAAREASFSPVMRESLEREVTQRLKAQGYNPFSERVEAEIQAELRRRVGQGTIAGRRRHAVSLAEQWQK